MVARLCRFKSCCPHQKKTIRKGCLFLCDSGLETKLRFVGKRHCVCLPLHAADAPHGNNIALLMLLRSLRSLQVLLSAPKQTKTNRNCSVRFFISWFATGLVTMQGIVCTLCVPLHAADAPLGNNIALLALLRSLRSLQVLLSAPKKRQSERVVFFHAAADLKQNYVLSANDTVFVCSCTLCSWRFTYANKFARFAITLVLLATSPVVRTKCMGL